MVGSMGLEDTPTVFRSLGEILGERARRYPDGETGERYYWLRWQQGIFEQHDQFERVEHAERYRLGPPLNRFRIIEGLEPQAVSIDTLGYTDAAIASYTVFADLKTQGVIPTATRFQVSLPTPVAVITTFILPDQQSSLEPVYEHAMLGGTQSPLPTSGLSFRFQLIGITKSDQVPGANRSVRQA